MRTVIQLEFLKVESGEEYTITIPEGWDTEEMAYAIRSELHKDGTIMTDVYIDHIISKEG